MELAQDKDQDLLKQVCGRKQTFDWLGDNGSHQLVQEFGERAVIGTDGFHKCPTNINTDQRQDIGILVIKTSRLSC